MRPFLQHSRALLGGVVLVVLLGSGCTHQVLQDNTLRSSTTLSSLQTQQVLDNLALLSSSEAANPCHVNLTGGLVQVTDQATGTLLGNLFSSGLASNNSLVPALSVQRGLVEQWSINPVADGEQLETLRTKDKIGPDGYLGLQEHLDWTELTLLRDVDRRIEEI